MSTAHNVVIAPSILSADFGSLAEAARLAESAGAEYLHFDVMDGRFVPNITFGPAVVQALRPHSAAFFDVHLMIAEPEKYLEDFARAGANGITVHFEASPHLQRTLQQIRKLGLQAGVAFNPHSPPDALRWVLDTVDLALVMTVNPGFGGQKFLPLMLQKIEQVRTITAAAPHPVRIEVDGGIDVHTAASVVQKGANTLVAGTAIFGTGAVPEAVQALRTAAREANA